MDWRVLSKCIERNCR